MQLISGMPVFGTHDQATLDQLLNVAQRAAKVALMADGHLGYIMPVGGVAAYPNMVSVAGVGYDIACGNAAIRTNLRFEDIASDSQFANGEVEQWIQDQRLNEFADEIQSTISFGIGRKNNADDAPTEHPLFRRSEWTVFPQEYREKLWEKARGQLGTVGSGNHYVDVLVDMEGMVWVGVHFGSRGLGHTIASDFMALNQGRTWGERVKEGETLLDLNTELGKDYWALMQLAGEYAYVGREWVARKVVRLLGGREVELVHNHHNFAWKEYHGDREYVVVRKGATPAFPGQRGFVGGSMGDNAVILEGTTRRYEDVLDLQRQALFSTVHGAGRVMSRTAAAGKRQRRTGRIIKPGLISPEDLQLWLDRRGVVLRGGGLDEAPQAYRRLPQVLEDQGPTVNVLEVLRPVIVVMAGANEWDPYKD